MGFWLSSKRQPLIIRGWAQSGQKWTQCRVTTTELKSGESASVGTQMSEQPGAKCTNWARKWWMIMPGGGGWKKKSQGFFFFNSLGLEKLAQNTPKRNNHHSKMSWSSVYIIHHFQFCFGWGRTFVQLYHPNFLPCVLLKKQAHTFFYNKSSGPSYMALKLLWLFTCPTQKCLSLDILYLEVGENVNGKICP